MMRETSQKRGDKMEIRLAFPNEVDAIMQVIEDARKLLAKAGSDHGKMVIPMLILSLMISSQVKPM